jgi:beta-lactamase class D
MINRLSILSSLACLFVILFASCQKRTTHESRNEFKKFYDQYNVVGSFVLYDLINNHYIFYNPGQYRSEFIPASTFKICNSLIGLETGVIKDENFVIKWDSTIRPIPSWNKDQDLKSAFKNSCVWYYQELARRVGGKQMKYWLDKSEYGNKDTTGGIDKFWLEGDLRISPAQQISFLRKLYANELPFSQRSIDIVKKIMIAKDTNGCIIRAKTGWGFRGNNDVGWYVGYIEARNNVYFFVNCIQSGKTDNPNFTRARIEIFYKVVGELGLLKRD